MSREYQGEATRELVARAQAGDRVAFESLVRRYQYRLDALVHLRLGPRLREHVEVADVRQEILLRAFTSLDQFVWRSNPSFFQWLGSIGEHVIGDLARRHLHSKKRGAGWKRFVASFLSSRRNAPGNVEEISQAPDPSPSKILRRNERLDRLEQALQTLPEDYREVVLLAFVHELPIKNIAEKIHRSPDAVSMLLLRALRKLKQVFGNTESFHLPPRIIDGGPPRSEETEQRGEP
jgi:RNA polymerase sigma-70 factor (ECF subfamily)